MRLGFVMLAHQHLDRAAALAGHLTGQGAAVAVHLDRRVADAGPLTEVAGLTVLQTRQADWGRFGLIEATLDCVRHLLTNHDLDHICLISGSCLPIRPIAELADWLAGQQDTDFIESVPVDQGWVQGGLSRERFTLYHPFSWRKQRRLFDFSVDLQRALRVHRRLPDGVQPHLGLQWWCLSTRTLRALIDDPRLTDWQRFFRRTWIPDEGFFQTLVHAVRPDAPRQPPLHLARFDPRGRPYTFHDDHADLLAGSGAWFARKIDPGADALYDRFLGPAELAAPANDIQPILDAARRREEEEGAGILSMARFPRRTTHISVATARPYLVVVADDPAAACAVLQGNPDLAVHPDLFGTPGARFAGGETLHWGNLTLQPKIRDHRAAQFLAMTVRADMEAGRRTVLGFAPLTRKAAWRQYSAGARHTVAGQIAGDPNARLVIVGDVRGMLERLRMANIGHSPKRALAQRPLRAWWTPVAAPCAGTAQLTVLGRADWTDPQGWTQPDNPPGGWPR